MSIEGQTMGTTYHIKVVPDVKARVSSTELKPLIDNELIAFNQIMSTYIPDSEINQFNRAPVNEWVDASRPFIDVLELSHIVSAQTQGSFDITVAPLVNLWGFGPEAKPEKVPSMESIKAAQARVGSGYIAVDQRSQKIKKSKDVRLDLSAVAKGDGVDRIAALLREHGYNNFMVEIGGELYLSGKKQSGEAWQIGVVSPDTSESAPSLAVSLSDVGMATSGDYRNYYEIDGQRYSHTIDPKTGRPITHNLASVTVIADSAAKADALATAFSVMGGDKAIETAERLNVAVYLIEREGKSFTSRHSSKFTAYLNPHDAI